MPDTGSRSRASAGTGVPAVRRPTGPAASETLCTITWDRPPITRTVLEGHLGPLA